MRYVLGISGASGSVIALRLMEALVESGAELHVVATGQALEIMRDESGVDWTGDTAARVSARFPGANMHVHGEHQMSAPIASGSYHTDGMFIVPCSMKTLAAVSTGLAETLLLRAADVTIKEGRRLVICPREMPLSAIHLENMLKLARLGVRVAPPIPAFYQKPATLDEMIAFFTGKLMDAMGVPNELYRRWDG